MILLRAGLRSVANWLWADEKDYGMLALIIGVALAIRVVWVVVFQTPPESDPVDYDRLAWQLAQGKGYVRDDGTPTAFRPVGYPAFLAAIYLVFGHSWLAAGVANALLGTLSVALTYRLASPTNPMPMISGVRPVNRSPAASSDFTNGCVLEVSNGSRAPCNSTVPLIPCSRADSSQISANSPYMSSAVRPGFHRLVPVTVICAGSRFG